MPEVSLIHYTGMGSHDPLDAARLLVFTKNTRLNMTPDGMESFRKMSAEQIHEELEYMAGTIPSSWEFVDLTFLITRVTRACAQQITRTRTASFAMQSQRVTDMSGVSYLVPDTVPEHMREFYEAAMQRAIGSYSMFVHEGVNLEDARGLLPLNTHSNLVAKYNLRSFVELVRSRNSLRVQGEYREMVQKMKSAVLDVWPWSSSFFEPKEEKSIRLIEEVAMGCSSEAKAKLAKAADLLKK